MGQQQHLTYRSITMVRGSVISMLYKKTAEISMTAVDPAASITLMSADIERIVMGMQMMHEIWSNSIEIGIAIYLLERQLGVACVVPIAVAICKIFLHVSQLNTSTNMHSVNDGIHWSDGLCHVSPGNVARSH